MHQMKDLSFLYQMVYKYIGKSCSSEFFYGLHRTLMGVGGCGCGWVGVGGGVGGGFFFF
jgi:hypothetical protein